MNRNSLIVMLMAAVLGVVGACRTGVPDKSSADFAPAIRAFYVGLAALQVGDDQRALTELKKTTELAADEPAAWNNQAVLQLRQKEFEAAFASIERAQKLSPDNPTILSNIARIEEVRGNSDKAVAAYRKVIELDPANLKAAFALAAEFERQTNDAEALGLFEKIAASKPSNLAAKLEIARIAAKLGDRPKLDNAIAEIGKSAESFPAEGKEQLAKLRNAAAADPRQAATQVSYLRNIMLREPAFRSAIAEIKHDDNVLGEVIAKPIKLPVPDFKPAAPDSEIAFRPEKLGSTSANFAAAVFLNSDKPEILTATEASTRLGSMEIPIGIKSPANFVLFDFDYDFRNDLAVAGENGFQLFHQREDGTFEAVTAKTGLSAEILRDKYMGIVAADNESDGDLDLLLFRGRPAPIVLQNNSNGTFTAVSPIERPFLTTAVVADFDEDGDPDVVGLGETLTAEANLRGGIYAARPEPMAGTAISAIAAGDVDGDGRLDVAAVAVDGGLHLLSSGEDLSNWTARKITDAGKGMTSIRIADIDNNGANDLVLSGQTGSRIILNDGNAFSAAANPINGTVTSVADLNADGKPDLIGVDQNGQPTSFINQSSKNYRWQIVRPRAAKTEGDQRVNTFGIGGEIEIRSGTFAQKQLVSSPQVHFGLGESAGVDVMRVVWGNGYVQAEFDLKPDQAIAAEQRLKGSCPHLFAWNGEEFELVKDAPPWSPALGLKINAQDTYGVLQTEEWFKIPGEKLKPKDGNYELRITGEYWESFYLDNYRLIVADHPADTEVFTDERFAIPLPPLKVFTTSTARPFASAADHNGIDVSAKVATVDEDYLDGIKRGTFQGVAEDHWVELTLPEDAPRDQALTIVADGWMHPTDASINVQRGQVPGAGPPKSLSLEVADDTGNWRVAAENLGFPAGKMKTVLIAIPPGARRMRIRTELEVFWDKLAWAVPLEAPSTKETGLEISAADLRYRGFSVIEKRDDLSPEKPDYDRILTTGQRWRDLEGYYTRFGNVTALLAATDDRMVLMNAGDELILKFPALPDPPAGWKRDFVIVGNGWIKDGDLNSVFSKTLLPLPTHVTNDYTRRPTRLEDDPVYQKNRQDWVDFHTRYVAPDRFRNAVRSK